MKPGEILKDYTQFIQAAKDRFDPAKAKARTAFETGSAFIKKFKLDPDKQYTVLVPLELCLPFDPVTLSQEVFNQTNPLPLPGSVDSAIKMLKQTAKANDAFADKLAEVLGVTVEGLKLDIDAVDSPTRLLFHKLSRIQFITGYVQHMNTKRDKFPFGRNVGAEVVLDTDGNITDTQGVGYRLYEMESAIISVEVQRVRDSYEPGGENADRPAKEMENAIKQLWSDRLIGNPYQTAYCRVFAFTLANKDGELVQTDVDAWNKTKKVSQFMRYMKLTREKMDTIESVLCTRSDVNTDFIEVIVDVPKAGDNGKINYQSVNYSTANRASSIFQIAEETGKPINNIEGFTDEYIKLRDDDKLWNDDILKKSIIEYRIPSDSVMLAEMSNSLAVYEDAMKSADILQSYGDILGQINSNLQSAIAAKIMDGDDNGKLISREIMESAPIMDENTAPTDEFNAEVGFGELLAELEE